MSAAQQRWFRLGRSGLLEPFESPEDTARRLIGVQAQLPVAAQLTFWNRTHSTSIAGLESRRLDERSLVRIWGQRNTLHLYASEDWPLLHALLSEGKTSLEKRLAQAGLEFKRAMKSVERRLERGETLTRAAAACGLFDAMILQMLSVGEEIGAVPEMCREIAETFEAEVDYELKNLSDTIEPIMIVVIGGIVLVLALGVYLPMWDMAGAAKGGG